MYIKRTIQVLTRKEGKLHVLLQRLVMGVLSAHRVIFGCSCHDLYTISHLQVKLTELHLSVSMSPASCLLTDLVITHSIDHLLLHADVEQAI